MCDVCNTEGITEVRNSACGAFSLRYCRHCLENGYEPYGTLVGMATKFEELNNELKKLVKKNLDYLDKTIEEFNKDVNIYVNEYVKYSG